MLRQEGMLHAKAMLPRNPVVRREPIVRREAVMLYTPDMTRMTVATNDEIRDGRPGSLSRAISDCGIVRRPDSERTHETRSTMHRPINGIGCFA